MVSQGDVRSLYRNILRREPDAGGLKNFMAKSTPLEVATALMNSDEYLHKVVRWTLAFWLQRDPIDREVVEWTANWHRLGGFECEWQISYSRESLDHFTQGVDKLPLTPEGQHNLWNLREYINRCILRYFGRSPNPPGDTIENAENGEWKRFFAGLYYGKGAEPVTKQAMRFVRADMEAVKNRVQWNYSQFLGREATPLEVRHWEPHLALVDFVPHIPASPEGLRHGLEVKLA